MNTLEMTELAESLRRLRQSDKSFRVFGSSSHRYHLQPKLSEAQLKRFEQTHQIRLPEDYRLFLQHIGNGGAGPFYGLQPLDEAAKYGDLSKPFPFVEATNFYEDEWTRTDARDEHPGALQICHAGCANYDYLIVNGSEYGKIWTANEDFYPTELSFVSWYLQWLERVLRVLANASLVDKLKLGMTKEQITSEIQYHWYERPSLLEPKYILASSDLPFRLELDEAKTLIKIDHLPFIG